MTLNRDNSVRELIRGRRPIIPLSDTTPLPSRRSWPQGDDNISNNHKDTACYDGKRHSAVNQPAYVLIQAGIRSSFAKKPQTWNMEAMIHRVINANIGAVFILLSLSTVYNIRYSIFFPNNTIKKTACLWVCVYS